MGASVLSFSYVVLRCFCVGVVEVSRLQAVPPEHEPLEEGNRDGPVQRLEMEIVRAAPGGDRTVWVNDVE